jgi:archaellum component FlaG (FlaF/FlaG flagellin family)
MPIRRSCNRLALSVVALVVAFVIAPAASAAALSTVVDVGMTPGSITPATVTGSAGDTFEIRNTGTTPNDPFYSITVQPGTGSVSIDGYVCDSGNCQIRDGVTKTVTIVTPGTLTIERWMGIMNSAAIGTLTIAAPAAPAAPAAAAPAPCDSSNWNFGVVDFEQTGYGDQILVTWSLPKVCSGTVASFALRQTTPDGVTTAVPTAACSPDLVLKAGSSDALWSCALKVAAVPANTLEFQVVATTSNGAQATSRSVKWVRGAAPNADVASPIAGSCAAANNPSIPGGVNANLVCFIVALVIQTQYAANGNQSLTDTQARELLNIGVAFSDTQSARSGRAAKAKWVSIGKKTMKIKKAGKLRVALPLSKKGTALLRKGPLKVRVTYTLTRGTAKRTIVQFATLPRIAS